MTEERDRSTYAAGVLRTLLSRAPQRENAYATMQLMQNVWLLEHGALVFEGGRLTIDYARYPRRRLGHAGREVLRIQRAGDRAAAEAFVSRWARWDDSVHGVIGPAPRRGRPPPLAAGLSGHRRGVRRPRWRPTSTCWARPTSRARRPRRGARRRARGEGRGEAHARARGPGATTATRSIRATS
ncbi:MAG: hypothetical protein M5U28_03835 [Sandaracinaceae bacterium]|nr:hypothetical protein [Sandaracinaceae bacterium]